MSKRWGLYGGIAGIGAAYYYLQKEKASDPADDFRKAAGTVKTTEQGLAGEKKALDPSAWKKFKVVEKSPITHNTYRLRSKSLAPAQAASECRSQCGLMLADQIEWMVQKEETMSKSKRKAAVLVNRAPIGDKQEDGSVKPVIRPYTPENLGDQKGHLDLIVKGYPQGLMSKHIVELEPGDELEFKGPIDKLPYKPNMKQKIGMIAGGSGLTPMLQVIKEIARNPEDKTEVTFVFANQSLEDIILKDELDDLAAKHDNINVYYLVDKAPKGSWEGGVGRLTPEIGRQQLPEPGDESLILVCGPPPMMKAISGEKAPDKSQGELSGILADIGFTKDQVYKF